MPQEPEALETIAYTRFVLDRGLAGDRLDLAFGLTATSRLGCQIIITEELDGLIVHLPASTRNMLLG